jgi:hypothetical protein
MQTLRAGGTSLRSFEGFSGAFGISSIVRKQARALSGGDRERKRRVRLAELCVKRAVEKVRKRREKEKVAKKRKWDDERMARVHVKLIFSRIGAMAGPKLDLQRVALVSTKSRN